MTPSQKVAQLVFPAYRFRTPDPNVMKLVDRGVGGFCLYEGQAAEWRELTRSLQKRAPTPLLFCADFEDGAGQIVSDATRMPSNMAVAATGSAELASLKAAVTAREARALGVGMVFAPCVDLNTNPRNPIINIRAFSDRPETTVAAARPMLQAYRGGGILSCLKHFPGHGDVEVDSHISTPVVRHAERRLRAMELAPFENLAAGADAVMTAHLLATALDPDWPASVSSKITTDLLRRRIGFDGVVVTDALCMGGIASLPEDEVAVRAVQAGADVLLYPTDADACIDRLVRALDSREISPERIEASIARLRRAKTRVGPVTEDPVRTPETLDAARRLAEASLTLARPGPGSLPVRGPVDVLTVIDGADRGASPEPFLRSLGAVQPDAPTLVVAIFIKPRAWAGRTHLTEEQKAPIRAACRPGRRGIGVSFGSPYLLKDLPELETFVCAYSDCEASQTAAARALRGEIPFRGRLPVTL